MCMSGRGCVDMRGLCMGGCWPRFVMRRWGGRCVSFLLFFSLQSFSLSPPLPRRWPAPPFPPVPLLLFRSLSSDFTSPPSIFFSFPSPPSPLLPSPPPPLPALIPLPLTPSPFAGPPQPPHQHWRNRHPLHVLPQADVREPVFGGEDRVGEEGGEEGVG